MTLKLWCHGHCIRKDGSLEKDITLGTTEGKRRRGGVAVWLRRSVANHARSTRVGSNPSSEPLTTS